MGVSETGISIVLAGEAGQGIQTIENMLTHVVRESGYYVFSTKEYLSRVRGGCNSTLIRVGCKPVAAYTESIDLLVALSPLAIEHCKKRCSEKTLILGDSLRIGTGVTCDVATSKMAAECGGSLYENTIAVGIVLGMLAIDIQFLHKYVTKRYAAKTQKIIDANVKASNLGHAAGLDVVKKGNVLFLGNKPQKEKPHLLLTGADALTLGALAGGCNFIASYPMSPGTGLLTGLASWKHEFPIVVEQAEDEIAAIIMGLGAWYAGARAVVTTSGGGFALMTEGISLSGIIETPIVVNIGMRPGPGTGLPTRTEQGDLDLALYAGHGEFPRAIYAPGNAEEIFECTHTAFDCADKFQIPAIILTDQFLVDSYFETVVFDQTNIKNDNTIVKTKPDYKRFALSESTPISPRGVPGFGEGLVRVDSDEHSEEGILTEDLELRVIMQNKRMAKHQLLVNNALQPNYSGKADAATLVVTFGSTKGPVSEALEQLNTATLAHLHFKQVYPLPLTVSSLFANRKKIIVVENNATGQFAKLLKRDVSLQVPVESLLQYNGMPFSVENLVKAFANM